MRLTVVQQRNDDEAVVDKGGARSLQGTNFQKEDLEGKRARTPPAPLDAQRFLVLLFSQQRKGFAQPKPPTLMPSQLQSFLSLDGLFIVER